MKQILCDLCGKKIYNTPVIVTIDNSIATIGEPSTEELHFHRECYVRTKNNFYNFMEKVREE